MRSIICKQYISVDSITVSGLLQLMRPPQHVGFIMLVQKLFDHALLKLAHGARPWKIITQRFLNVYLKLDIEALHLLYFLVENHATSSSWLLEDQFGHSKLYEQPNAVRHQVS